MKTTFNDYFGKLEKIAIDNTKDYIKLSYNDINLYVTSDYLMFNATKLFKSFKSVTHSNGIIQCKLSFKQWLNGAGSVLKQQYPNKFKEVSGKGTQKYKGCYVSVELFFPILFNLDIAKTTAWLCGDSNWQDVGEEGHLYLLQPAKFKDTFTYKIGACKDIRTRVLNNLDYGKGTTIYGIVRVSDMSRAEKLMKKAFNELANKVEGKEEYFDCISYHHAKSIFENADIEDLDIDDMQLYEPDEYVF